MMRSNARSPSITSQESFSAVMITDLVADVNVNAEDTRKTTKEETNLAFDGEIKCFALEEADSTKVNGANISKGVVLNAVQLSSNDSKKTFDEKPIQLTASLTVPTLTQPIPETKGFANMSLTRKIAFGFSFLPSIFFVLCFAVILPCKVPKQCVEEAWITSFNNTEPLSRLELSEKIVLTAFKENRNVLLELEKIGGESTEILLPSPPAYVKCGKILYEDQKDCMVMDELGKVYTMNNTHSQFLWNPMSEAEYRPPSPLILPGCSGKLDDIGVPVSNTIIKFLLDGNKITNFLVTHCDSIPMHLFTWKIRDSSDIIFVCNKDGEDRLVKIPKSAWCITESDKSPEKPLLLKTGPLHSFKESIIEPLDDNGLVLWSKHEICMMHPNGTILWNVSNLPQPEENRFILHGKFIEENNHLAFISSNLTSGLQLTLLNPSDGSLVKKFNFEETEAFEVVNIKGDKRDFFLLLLRKVKPATDTMTAAFTRISDISSTIISILSNENMSDSTSSPIAQELAILDLEGNLETVKEIVNIEDPTFSSTMTAITDQHGILNVYLLSAFSNLQMKSVEIRNINVANWDKSSKHKCLAKE